MSGKVTLDSAGRVVIPKRLRDALRLEPGDTFLVETEGEAMTLRPVRSGSATQRENGVWVFRSGQRLSAAETDKALQDVRHGRDRAADGSES
jgi:AbrB family looped-hinge helix DNA binding protein